MARNEKMQNAVAAVEGRTATIGEICEKAKSRIIAEVQRHAAKHPQSPWNGKPLVELERTLRKLYADWGTDAKKEFSATLPETMREWRKLAFDAIREDGASVILGEPNTDTVKFFLNDSFSRIAARTERMAADHISQLRRISAEVFRTASITGETRTQISRRLIAEAMDIKGFAFIDKAGRRWGDKSYFSMLARTELMNAGRTAYMDKCAEEGYDVMELSTSGDSCEACAQYEGELFSLTGAVAGLPAYGDLLDAGVFHPNCTHSFYAVPESVWRERLNQPEKETGKPTDDAEADREAMEKYEAALNEALKSDNVLDRYKERTQFSYDEATEVINAVKEREKAFGGLKYEDALRVYEDCVSRRISNEEVKKAIVAEYTQELHKAGIAPPSVLKAEKASNSFFHPLLKSIVFNENSEWSASRNTAAHEFGHFVSDRILWKKGNYFAKMRNAIEKDDAGDALRKLIEDSRNQPDIYYFSKRFGFSLFPTNEEKYLSCAFSDSIGSVRGYKLELSQYGHDSRYYERMNKDASTFAIELYAHYNMLRKYPKFFAEFKRIFPNFVEQYEKILKAEKVLK